MSQLEQHYITKIEGHGILNLSFKECKAKLQITEGERLFEALLLGRPYQDGPFITSRICGVCPVAHTLASIKALENTLDIKVDDITIKLRKILLASQIIQSHALHLYFLTLPDYLKISSTMDLSNKKPRLFASALKIKKLGDDITKIIGGRAVHPITCIIGGFTKIPNKHQLEIIKLEVQQNITFAKETVKLFADFVHPNFTKQTQYLSLASGENYEVYDGQVETSNNYIFNPADYKKEINEVIKFNSPAKYSTHSQKALMVGALARISMHQQYLNPLAKKALKSTGLKFPTYNSFDNNLAQAIEILHFLEEIVKLCDELISSNDYLKYSTGHMLLVTGYKIKAGSGIGAIEAPRGTLYHYYEIDKKGIITNCDIITPTAQNLTNLEEDATALLKEFKLDKLDGKVCVHELEMLIRAYDPCITCSVH